LRLLPGSEMRATTTVDIMETIRTHEWTQISRYGRQVASSAVNWTNYRPLTRETRLSYREYFFNLYHVALGDDLQS
jgi:hypothetical protein